MQTLHKYLNYYKRILEGFMVLAVLSMAFIIFLTVVTRYVFNSPLLWGVEVGRILLVWITFVGAILVTAERKHIRVLEIVQFALNTKMLEAWEKIINAITIIFIGVFGYYAFLMSQTVIGQTTYALRIPFRIYYIPLLIFCVSSILFLIAEFSNVSSEGGAD